MDFNQVLKDISETVRPMFGRGKVADYIPALAEVPADRFGMALCTVGGETFSVGDASDRFSIQSISKVFTLSLALDYLGEDLWRRVGLEPSGNRFNSLVQLERENGIPRNPFINAGALVISDVVLSHTRDPRQAVLDYMRVLSGAHDIDFDPLVARSEAETGFINAALANFLKGHRNLENDVGAVLDLYFHQCSLAMSCQELARAAVHLANSGVSPFLGESVLTNAQAQRINAIMMTCGLYDAVGEFAYRVGLPAKSGVGGGILAVLPDEYTVVVWSPELDAAGNSMVGGAALEALVGHTGRSVF